MSILPAPVPDGPDDLTIDDADRDPALQDQWRTGLLLAASQDDAAVRAIIDRLERPDADPRGWATAARLRWLLGDDAGARRALHRALQSPFPDHDLAALATLAHPDGDRWGRARLATGSPGQQADAACDLAWRCLAAADVEGGHAWVQEALSRCPEHAEALHWQRFLRDCAGDVGAVLDRALGDPTAPGWFDAFELVPQASLGWFSRGRLRRRVLGPPMAPEGSALAWLRDRGIGSRILATDSDYARLSPDHDLVAGERALDLALCLDAEERSPREAVAAAWDITRAVDHQAAADAAQLVVALGCRHDEISALALDAVAHLQAAEPGRTLWTAYRVHLLAQQGDEQGVRRELEALGPVADLDAVGLSLVVDALRRIPAGRRRAEALLEAAHRLPHLSAMAHRLDADPVGGLTIVVSDRLQPRGIDSLPGHPAPEPRRGRRAAQSTRPPSTSMQRPVK